MSTPGGLGARVQRGATWAYASYVGGRLLILVSTAILARLLGPEEFGLVALALVFTALLETLRDFGVTQALIVDRDDGEARASTAFAFGFVVALLLWALAAALGPFAAAFFDEPDLVLLLAVLGANFPLRALGATHYALAQKRLDFRSRAIAEGADIMVRGTTGVVLAITGAGAYSLVLGYLAGTIALSATIWALVEFRPRRAEIRRRHLASLVRFGGTLAAVDIVAAINNQADYLIAGRVLGTSALGLYTLAFRLPEILIRNLSAVAGQVLFPAFASLPLDRVGDAYVRSLRLTAAVAAPTAIALAVLAEPLVLTVFGDQWRGAVDAMRVLAAFALVTALNVPAGSAFKATGRAGLLLALSVPRGIALIVALVLFAHHGLVAVALCQLATSALSAAVGIVVASRMLRVALGRIAGALWAPAVATAAAGAALAGVGALFETWLAVIAGAAVGVPVYLAAIRLTAPDVLATIAAPCSRGRAGRGPGRGG